jgi:hypothetical protein
MSIDLWLTSQDVMGNRFAKEKDFAKPMDSKAIQLGLPKCSRLSAFPLASLPSSI